MKQITLCDSAGAGADAGHVSDSEKCEKNNCYFALNETTTNHKFYSHNHGIDHINTLHRVYTDSKHSESRQNHVPNHKIEMARLHCWNEMKTISPHAHVDATKIKKKNY